MFLSYIYIVASHLNGVQKINFRKLLIIDAMILEIRQSY